jgi:hypothetical protein
MANNRQQFDDHDSGRVEFERANSDIPGHVGGHVRDCASCEEPLDGGVVPRLGYAHRCCARAVQ